MLYRNLLRRIRSAFRKTLHRDGPPPPSGPPSSGVAANVGAAFITASGFAAIATAGAAVTIISGSVTAVGGSVGTASVPASGVIEPNTADGLPILQLGMSDLNGSGGENPWVNYRTLLNSIGGGEIAKITADEWDPQTGFLFVPPSTVYTIDRVRPLAAPPGNFDIDPGVWVLKATVIPGSGIGGAAPTVDIKAPGFVVNGSSGNVIRKTEDVTGQLNGDQVTLDGGANGGRIRIDYWGPQIYEGSPNDFHPNAKKYYGRYKVLRNLDWVDASGSKITRDSQWINDDDYIKHRSANSMSATPPASFAERERAGASYGEFFRLCVSVNSAAYCCIPFALGGASVDFELRNYGSGGSVSGLQLRDAVALNGSAIIAASQNEYYLHGRRIGSALAAQNYPKNRVLFIELGNEPWNGGNFAFARTKNYFDALGRFLTGSDNWGQGYGAIAARAFKMLKKGILETYPGQELVYIMGMQTAAFFGSGSNALTHIDLQINAFIASDIEAVPKIDIWLATTGYISGAHFWNKNRSPVAGGNPWNATSEPAFDAAFIGSHSTDPVAHRQVVRDWYMNPASTHDSTSKMIVNNNGFMGRAHTLGYAGVLQYEGSFADTPIVGTLPTAYPTVQTAVLDFIRSSEGETVMVDAIARMRAINPTNPAKTSGWRPNELMIANYRDAGRRLAHTVTWVEREADALNATIVGQMASAWQAFGRLQQSGSAVVVSAATVSVVGGNVTANVGVSGAVTASPGAASVSASGSAVTASQSSSVMLGSWDINQYATIEEMGTDGWNFTGDWRFVQDGGQQVLFGTSGEAISPQFRTQGESAPAARFICSMKVGDVVASGPIASFIESSTGLSALLHIGVDEKVSAIRPGSAAVMATAVLPQPIGDYDAFGSGYFASDASGLSRIVKNGAINASFSGDTDDAGINLIDRVSIIANSGGVYIRNVFSVFSDPAGGISTAFVIAETQTGQVTAVGSPVIAQAGSGQAALFSWSVDTYATIAAMESAGFTFQPGHNWFIDIEGGERVLKGTNGWFSTPLFRAPSSGQMSAGVFADIRTGAGIVAEAQIMSIHDSVTDKGAAVRIGPSNKVRVRRFGGNTTVLTAVSPQSSGGFNETDIFINVDNASGVITVANNGAANGSFAGDTLETAPAGIDTVKFYGIFETTSLRRTVTVYANGASSQSPVTASPGAAFVSASGSAVTASVVSFAFSLFRVDYEAGIPADFPVLLSLQQVPDGVADAMITGAQNDYGDIRVFSSDGTQTPASLAPVTKAGGKFQMAARTQSALQYGDFIAVRNGGSGSEVFPSPTDAFGEQAVFTGTGATFFTHGDYSKNIVTGQAMVKDGSLGGGGSPLTIAAGLGGFLATGFGPVDGSGSFDGADITSIQYPSAMKMVGLFDLNSQGGVAGPGLNRGRILHGSVQGPEILFNAGTMSAEIEFDVADGTQQRNWTWPLPSFATPFSFQFSFDGSGDAASIPTVKISGVSSVVTDVTAIPQTGKTALATVGPMTFGNHYIAHDRNTDGIMSTMILGDATWGAPLMDALETQVRDPLNFLKKVSTVSVIPSYVATKIAESYNAALAAPLSSAHLQELDELFIRPMVRDGNMALAYALNDFSSRGAAEASTKNILRVNSAFDLTVFSGAPTFNAGASTVFDGVDDAYETNALIGSGGLSRDDFSIILFELGAAGHATPAIGARGAGSQTYAALNPRNGTDLLTGRMGLNVDVSSTPTTYIAPGMRAVTARSSTDRAIYAGGTQVATQTTASSNNPSWTLVWGGLRSGAAAALYSSRTIGFGMLVRGLTTARMAQIDGYLTNLMTARGII